jgi:hypothetical protein
MAMEENARMELAVVNQAGAEPIPAFKPAPANAGGTLPADLREQMTRAVEAWKLCTPSAALKPPFNLLLPTSWRPGMRVDQGCPG